ncbi:hypothetical protein HK096_006782, partial [Nowakowskiella sp. JEL0078]
MSKRPAKRVGFAETAHLRLYDAEDFSASSENDSETFKTTEEEPIKRFKPDHSANESNALAISPVLSLGATSFPNFLKSKCEKEWSQYINHEFVKKIADGTLPLTSFQHFIRQGYLYLTHYARAYALVAFKEQNFEDIAAAGKVMMSCCKESNVNLELCKGWGISKEELENTKESMATLAYSRYILEKGMSGDKLDLCVALAPCLLGYGEIGLMIKQDPKAKKEGVYWDFIKSFSENDYLDTVRDGEELLIRLHREMVPESNIARLQNLCEIFRQATIFEVKFWD